MSVIEGHAEHVMDACAPAHGPDLTSCAGGSTSAELAAAGSAS